MIRTRPIVGQLSSPRYPVQAHDHCVRRVSLLWTVILSWVRRGHAPSLPPRSVATAGSLRSKPRPPLPHVRAPWRSLALPERPEPGSYLLGEEFRLLPGREVVAPVDLVEVDEVVVRALSPAPRRLVHLAREDADGGRDLDALDVPEPELVLPVEPGRRDARVRQPRERDVVQDLVPRETADGLIVHKGP